MRIVPKSAAWALLAGCLMGLPARAEIVDRVVAVVDQTLLGSPATAGQIITWSEVYEEASYQAFQAGAEPPQWSPSSSDDLPQFREVLARMIDQLLLEQALKRSPLAPSGDEDISGRIQDIAGRYPDAESFQRQLARYRLSEAALTSRLQREQQILDFVDFTLRPDVRITTDQIRQYYDSALLPQLESATRGAGPAARVSPLEDVRDQIEEVLTQQEINRRLEQWLSQMRRSARIDRLP